MEEKAFIMTQTESEQLIVILEYEIFNIEAIISAFNLERDKQKLRSLEAILKKLKASDDQTNIKLNQKQKDILYYLVKQAKIESQRVVKEQAKIKEIQKNAKILCKLEKYLH